MDIIIRRAKLKDVPFIRSLALRSVHFGIPETRRIDVEVVRQYTRESLKNLEMQLYRNDFVILVAEDTHNRKTVGYIMLDLNDMEGSTGEKQCMIHDLAVEPEYWGKFVVDRLMAEAEEVTLRCGLLYIVGEITANNRRPLIYSTRRLHYTIERHQIVKPLHERLK